MTKLRRGHTQPIVVFHKDEGLKTGDLVLTTLDGRVSITRFGDPQIAEQNTNSQQSDF